jgi:hypothetical protein
MTHYAGSDVSQKLAAICVVDDRGGRVCSGDRLSGSWPSANSSSTQLLVSVQELIESLESVSTPLLKSLNRLPFCLPRAIFWGTQCGPRRTAAAMTAAACGMTVI